MKKIVAALIIVLVITSLFFIRLTQHAEVVIKAPILTLYSTLTSPTQWKKWRPDLRKVNQEDTSKISIQKSTRAFTLNYDGKPLSIQYNANLFLIADKLKGTSADYNYTLLPRQLNDSTSVIVTRQISLISYLLKALGRDVFADTHIADLKNFMETDSLRYGFPIHKTTLTYDNVIEIKREVLAKDQYATANSMFKILQLFAKKSQVTQAQPLLAEFKLHGKDSASVRVGLIIDKPVKTEGEVNLVHMLKGASCYTALFNGAFNRRVEAYQALNQFYADHRYQQPIPPFEVYLDNKLPANDTDKVKMLIYYSTY